MTAEGVPLKRLLLETYSKELVETSPFDRVWGIGFGVKEAPLRAREQWGGGVAGKGHHEGLGVVAGGDWWGVKVGLSDVVRR